MNKKDYELKFLPETEKSEEEKSELVANLVSFPTPYYSSFVEEQSPNTICLSHSLIALLLEIHLPLSAAAGRGQIFIYFLTDCLPSR